MKNHNLRENCQYYRQRQGYSQEELAKSLNVHHSTLSKWESGQVRWPPGSLKLYAELLELNLVETEELIALATSAPTVLLVANGRPEVQHKEKPVQLNLSTNSATEMLKNDAATSNGKHLPKRRSLFFVFVGLLVAVAIAIVFWNLRHRLPPPAWQEVFNPLQWEWWSPSSAVWEDVQGPTAVLRENNPDADFGKVETKPIDVDISAYPILRIRVKDIDLHTSYTVQILDKQTGIPMDVLKAIDYPGEVTVDLAEALGWEGSHAFTINIWIAGEGNAATFELISIEAR